MSPNKKLYNFFLWLQGTCPKSFGINVARLAGIPHEVLVKAKQISADFEKEISSFESSKSAVTSEDAIATKERLLASINHADWKYLQNTWHQMQ
jgi:DNA mismatch repair ATPase MutS